MTNTNKLSIAYTIAAFAGSVCLHAEDQPARNQDADASPELADTVVVANTYEVPINQVGSTVELITREDLEIGQTTFITDNLRELPGVYVRNTGNLGSSFGITTRGLNDSPVILIDGIEVSNPVGLGIFNPGTVFSNSVESIEFLKGSQSSLYGADALAGVINIQTREAKEGETNFQIAGGYGTYDSKQGSISMQTQQGKFDFTADINRYTSDGFSSLAANREDDGYENNTYRAKLGYQATEALKLFASIYYIDATVDTDSSGTDPYGSAEDEQFFARTGANLQVNELWNTGLSYGYTHVDSTSKGSSGTYKYKGERNKVSWKNALEFNTRWSVAGGAEYEEEEARQTGDDRDDYSYYVDNSLEVIDNLFWTLGGRSDDNSDYGTNETWRTTLSYLIEPVNSRLHGSYGTSFTAPSFFQTYNPTFGNPDLDAEEGESWDIGLEAYLFDDKLVVDVTYFNNEIDDQIIYIDPDGWLGPNPGTYINNDSYESDGVEVTATWYARKNLVISANYTYTDAENDDGSTPVRIPEQMANLSATWKTMDNKLDLKASVQYVDQRLDGYGGSVTVDDYTTVNLAGQYAFSEVVTVWTSLNNLFDEDYQEVDGYNTPGFNMMVGLRLNF